MNAPGYTDYSVGLSLTLCQVLSNGLERPSIHRNITIVERLIKPGHPQARCI